MPAPTRTRHIRAKPTRTASRDASRRSRKSPQSRIPKAFELIETEAAIVATRAKKTKDGVAKRTRVPMLVLRGEWLKAVGFPIGSAAVLTTDRRGELTLHRLGLGFPRRLRVIAARVASA
jgi:hypothetical protein